MAVKSDLVSGTITLTNGSLAFTGTGTSFLLSDVRGGDEFLQIAGQTQWQAMVDTITSNTAGTLVRPWGGASGTYKYRLRYQPDGTRSTAQARQLIELLGDGTLLSLAGLSGPGVIELLAGGGAQVVPRTDFVSGVAVNARVETLAERAAYDGQPAQFAVYVNDIGDGRAAVYFKQSAASADWSTPAIQTGQEGEPGPFTHVTFGPVTTVAATTPASANVVVVDATTIRVDLSIPKGMDGAGTISSIVAGPGISVNTTNPNSPVISARGIPAGGASAQVLTKNSGADYDTSWQAAVSGARPGHIYGCSVSNNVGTPTTHIDFAAGECVSGDGATLIIAAALTKRLDAAWASGAGLGMRDTGAIADGTWHLFDIFNPTTLTADYLASLSPTAPMLPSGFTKFRRRASILRVAGAILGFRQFGDMFKLNTQVADRNSTTPVADALLALTVPTGIRVAPIVVADMQMNAAGTGVQLFSDGDQTSAQSSVNRVAAAGEYAVNLISQSFVTNTAAQLRFTLLNPTGTLSISRLQTQGWFDPRGQ